MFILLCKPGLLTKEYFAERRARYLPPVRVYLVLSVLFFAFGLATPNKYRVVTLPEGTTAKEALKKLTAEDAPASAAKSKPADDDSDGLVIAPGADNSRFFDKLDCEKVETSIKWLKDPLRESCRRNIGNHGETVKHAFIANIPKMMFVFVPLMALVMLLLYWRPRRYYVEHLVFFLHNHAAIFLIWIVMILLGLMGRGVFVLGMAYMLWYVYRSMRVFYAQGRCLTLGKMMFMYVAYFSLLTLIGLATFFISELTA